MTAAEMKVEVREQVVADEGADDADDEVADQPEAAAGDDEPGEPAGDDADHDDDEKVFPGHARSPLLQGRRAECRPVPGKSRFDARGMARACRTIHS